MPESNATPPVRRNNDASQMAQPPVNWLLNYEMELSARHRRFVSLVIVESDRLAEELDLVLSEWLRSSDVRYFENNGIAVVMGDTSNCDARHAVSRYQSAISDTIGLRCSIASYPSDGRTPNELKHVAHRRLERAKAMGDGAVVADG